MFVITLNNGAIIATYKTFDNADTAVRAQFDSFRAPYAYALRKEVGYCNIVAEWKYFDTANEYRIRLTQLGDKPND